MEGCQGGRRVLLGFYCFDASTTTASEEVALYLAKALALTMLPWRYFASRDSEEVHRRFHTLIRDLYQFIRYLLLGSPRVEERLNNDEAANVPDLVANIQDSSSSRRPDNEYDRDEGLS